MKRWIEFATVLYPRSWREEFGPEFGAFLDDVKPSWRVFRNVLVGAIEMQITTGTNWLKVVGATAAIGAILASVLSLTVTPHYVSSAVVSVASQPDPVRPTSPEVLRQRTAARTTQMETAILSRTELSAIINDPRLLLYKTELQRKPLEDVIEQMRHDIRIEARPAANGGPIVFTVSFSYPDQAKAQAAVAALVSKFTEMNLLMNRARTDAYLAFWGDIADKKEYDNAGGQHLSAAHFRDDTPPPPLGDIVRVAAGASMPVEASDSRYLLFPAWGLGAGLLLGVVMAFAIRRPGPAWRLTAFAVTGFVLAAAVSYLIPNRYASTGVMQISPALLTEDPTAPLPAATPATEFLGKIQPEVLSFQRLSSIINNPRLNLYVKERTRKSMEEVVRDMVANDISIMPVTPALGGQGAISAFRITFSYPDRLKAQQAVQALMSAFDEVNVAHQMSDPSQNLVLRNIHLRKAGEIVDVLDTATLPQLPVKPNRLVIALMGLFAGLVAGAFRLRSGRDPRYPIALPNIQTES